MSCCRRKCAWANAKLPSSPSSLPLFCRWLSSLWSWCSESISNIMSPLLLRLPLCRVAEVVLWRLWRKLPLSDSKLISLVACFCSSACNRVCRRSTVFLMSVKELFWCDYPFGTRLVSENGCGTSGVRFCRLCELSKCWSCLLTVIYAGARGGGVCSTEEMEDACLFLNI